MNRALHLTAAACLLFSITAAPALAETRIGVRAAFLTTGADAMQPGQDGGSYGPWVAHGAGLSLDAELAAGPIFAIGVGARMTYATGEEGLYGGDEQITVAALRLPFLMGWRFDAGAIALRVGLEAGLEGGWFEAAVPYGLAESETALGFGLGVAIGLDVPIADGVDLTLRGLAGLSAVLAGGDAERSGWGEALIGGFHAPVEAGLQWRF